MKPRSLTSAATVIGPTLDKELARECSDLPTFWYPLIEAPMQSFLCLQLLS
ncbi:hypothetical protein DPMN_151668 [Dreissena polymorpha]|uniref:Uncharacterized protein n=1 Tax=Dreissena polymorpha TaxID=45954 RepID=A0A9D4J770_DREPO|nr:hypothetical protein DPMN_151668 [Dreissena polymorpha]